MKETFSKIKPVNASWCSEIHQLHTCQENVPLLWVTSGARKTCLVFTRTKQSGWTSMQCSEPWLKWNKCVWMLSELFFGLGWMLMTLLNSWWIHSCVKSQEEILSEKYSVCVLLLTQKKCCRYFMIFKVKSCQKMSQILPELVVISACSVPLAALSHLKTRSWDLHEWRRFLFQIIRGTWAIGKAGLKRGRLH